MKKPVLSGKYSRSAPKEAPNGLEIVRTTWNQFEIVLAGCERFEPLIRLATKPANEVVKVIARAKLNT